MGTSIIAGSAKALASSVVTFVVAAMAIFSGYYKYKKYQKREEFKEWNSIRDGNLEMLKDITDCHDVFGTCGLLIQRIIAISRTGLKRLGERSFS